MSKLILLLFFAVQNAFAQLPPIIVPSQPEKEELPLYELGVGLGGTYSPAYPGSDENNFWLLPYPYAVYRGEVFRSDKEGTRARVVHDRFYEFSISSGGGLPSRSDKLEARRGMPDLEWLGMIGPAIDLYLTRNKSFGTVKFSLPIRAAFSTNFKSGHRRGFSTEPLLIYSFPKFLSRDFEFDLILATDFADKKFMGYFYEVPSEYATATRPVYSAKAGYLQSSLTFTCSYWIPKTDIRISPFVTYATLNGATNEASPLLRSTSNLSASLLFTWEFKKSEKNVSNETF